MEEIIEKLQKQIDEAIECNQPLDEASWGYEQGVIITVNEAKGIIELLSSPKREDEKLNCKNNVLAEIDAYCAFNKGEIKNVQDISFHNTKEQGERYWGNSQTIKKCKIIIYSETE